jgi:formyl-CoA transferase
MAGALEGIRILEFSEIIAAPFAGTILADLGADVIKIEPPAGEPWRMQMLSGGADSAWFLSLNRGKRGLAIDLKSAEGREAVHKLVPSADVVIVNFRPDTPGALAIDYETLRPLNPRLIYVQNTAFGPKGPQAHRPGYDLIAQAMTGLMATDGKLDDAGLPVPMNPPMADYSTGLTLAFAVCAALYVREKTGAGQKIEASLMATALAVQGNAFIEGENLAQLGGPAAQRLRDARERGASWHELQEITAEARGQMPNAYYRSYETADGIIAVGCLSPALWGKFSDAIEVPDPRFQAGAPSLMSEEGRALAFEFVALCEVRMREKTTDEWLAMLDAGGVPAGPLRMVDELRTDPQILANGLVAELDHPKAGHLRMFGPLFTMSANEPVIGRPAPVLGEHNDEVLTEAGYTEAEIAKLRESGVVT